MKTNDEASVSLLKISAVCAILIFVFSIGIKAFGTQINGVENIITGNSEEKIIEITNEKNNMEMLSEESTNITLEEVLQNYGTITEKIVTVQEVIPFETITKDSSSGAETTRTTVIQNGKDGLKEVTYKIKYQNDIEIEKTVVSEKIISEPVNKIIQLAKTTSRSNTSSRTNAEVAQVPSDLSSKVAQKTPVVKNLNTSAYTASTCGKSPSSPGYGITASGQRVKEWYTVAAGKSYPIGTIIYIPYFKDKPNGGWFVVTDRGGAITDGKLDVYMGTYNECISFGRITLECYIYL